MALERVAGKKGPGSRKTVRPFRVLALDPGGTTGWAYAEWLGEGTLGTLQYLDQIHFEWGELTGDDHHESLWELLMDKSQDVGPPLDIMCESFEFRQHIDKEKAKTGVELISKEYIGIVKFHRMMLLSNSDLRPVNLHFETASQAKSFIPDKGPQAHKKLKWLGHYVTGSAHINDAKRHLFRFLVRELGCSFITDIWFRKAEEEYENG